MSAPERPSVRFLDYVLDASNAEVRRGSTVLSVRPKTFAVLEYLVAHPGRLVTKSEFLDAVWPETAVGEWVLTGCIQELRRLFEDDPRQARIIQTAHGRGYRFVAQVEEVAAPGRSRQEAPLASQAGSEAPDPSPLVGRSAELEQLDGWLRRAFAGEPLVGFVAGEAGIGKTALVDQFLRRLWASPAAGTSADGPGSLLVARGQCIEQHGAGEPYLPVLEALGRLCRGADGERLVAWLRRHAPTWLVQLPGVLDPEEAEGLERRLGTSTRGRMLREMASFVAALQQPLVLVLEDLHWSDHATVDLVSMLAQQRDAARLLVIATYRPVDVVVSEHPLKFAHQELRARGRCQDLWLQPLEPDGVAEYIGRRWPGVAAGDELVRAVYERTDGNPLFLVNVADYLVAEGLVLESEGRWSVRSDAPLGDGVPLGLRQLITMHVDRLGESERTLLEAGSCIGRIFSAALVAAAVDDDVVEVERRLARLAEAGQLVRAAGEQRWPDATAAGAYELSHFLYQSVLRDRVPPARRRQLHARVAARLETAYRQRLGEVGAELAHHFEMSGDPDRAVPHLEEAAARAVRRGAGHEAVALLEHGLAQLQALPVTAERTLQTIRLNVALGAALPTLNGVGDPAAEAAYLRARALSEEAGDPVQLFQALAPLVGIYVAQARLGAAAEAADAITRLMAEIPLPPFLAGGNMVAGIVQFHSGDLATAQRQLEQTLALDEVPLPATSADPHVYAANYLALVLLHRGYPDQARARNLEAGQRAAQTGRPFDRLITLQFDCFLNLLLRDVAGLRQAADEALALATELDLAGLRAVVTVARGRALAAAGEYDEGAVTMADGLALYRASQQRIALPSLFGWSIEAHLDADAPGAAQPLLDEAFALVRETGEVRYLAELHRLQGLVHNERGDRGGAENAFRRAIELARQQGARWWELRAATSLAQLTSSVECRAALAALVGAFTEGGDTIDVRVARAASGRSKPRRGRPKLQQECG